MKRVIGHLIAYSLIALGSVVLLAVALVSPFILWLLNYGDPDQLAGLCSHADGRPLSHRWNLPDTAKSL